MMPLALRVCEILYVLVALVRGGRGNKMYISISVFDKRRIALNCVH